MKVLNLATFPPDLQKTSTMSKSKKVAPKPVQPAARAAAQPISKPLKNWLDRPAPAPENVDLLKKIFGGVAMVSLLVMLWLAMGSGINADDKYQNDYSEKLVNYYSTFGRDTSALFIKDGNMHLYGGFFEIVTGFANKTMGFTPKTVAYHNVRHVSSAFLGWVAILCAALLARLIAGWQAAILTFLLLFLSPRFLGDSLMNPKDIPFAAGYMMALYNLAVVLRDMPQPRRANLWGLVGGLAMALATRAGGLLPFAYLFLFAGLHWFFNGWLKNEGEKQPEKMAILKKYLGVSVGVSLVGYALAVVFWPYALQNPLTRPLHALSQFSALEVQIRVLFEGKNVMSDVTPWYYAPKWIGISIPLAALFGFFGCLVLVPRLFKNYNPLLVSLVLFAAIFPVFYVVYKDSVLHDGWRHLTFAYPAIAIAAALFWNELSKMFGSIKPVKYAIYGVFALMLADSTAFIFQNSKFPYTYFNPLVGGTDGAFGKYETDYWGVSVRQGLEWMEKEGILKPEMTDTVTIATNMYYSAKMLCDKYGGHARVRYLKWDRRCDEAWDYALFPTRFIDGSTLQKGFWPPENAVHTIFSGGAPILTILKNAENNCFAGMDAVKKGNPVAAVDFFKKEVAVVPDNDLAWASLGNVYMNLNNLDSSKICADKALEINPDDVQSNNLLGLILINKNDIAGAKKQFEEAARREPSNAAAWYYLGLLAHNSGDNSTAMNHVKKAIEIAPNFKPAYQLGLQISQATGNQNNIKMFQSALSQLK